MTDLASRWTREAFLIANPDGPAAKRQGWTYRGLGLWMMIPGSLKGRRKPLWSITHLGSGHLVVAIEAAKETAIAIATELAEAGDWSFEGLEGWKNQFPEAHQVVLALMTRYKCARRTGTATCEAAAQQIAAARYA